MRVAHRVLVRGNLGRKTSEIFFRKVRFWKGDAPPVFVSHE